MYAGDVETEVVGDDAMNDQMDNILVEGINDTANERPARCCRITNGICWQNAHMDFSAGRNDPAAWFHHVSQAFASLDALTNAVAQSFSVTSQAPTCSLIDVAIDFEHASDMLIWAQEKDDSVAIAFYKTIRQQYISEQARIVSGNVQLDG
jgi:hypothetical protein